MKNLQKALITLVAMLAFIVAGCATPPAAPTQTRTAEPNATAASAPVVQPVVARATPTPAMDRATEDRLLALDPEHLSADDVRLLASGPTPRIILLHGGIFPVYLLMQSFGEFLTGMGYPEAQIRDPGNGDWSYSPYEDSAQIAGLVAWQYEHDGVRPMIVGHSQGGIQAVKVLRELSGMMSESIPVWNPVTRRTEGRTSITDPLTGAERPVVGGTSVAYASAVGAGGAAFLLPNQWNMVGKLRSIPDSVDEFTGFNIGLDLVAWVVPGADDNRFRENGKALVRSVELPASYNHITVPVTAHLPADAETRAWIEAYAPGSTADPWSLPGDAGVHVLWAGDVWYSIKKHWCIEAQRLIRARRAANRADTVARPTE